MYLCGGFGEPMAMNCIRMDMLMFQEVEDLKEDTVGVYCGKDKERKVGMWKGGRYGS